MSVFDSLVNQPIWKGQNHRTQQVGFFPRNCLSTTTTNTNERISWPVRGSFIHTGHRDVTGQGRSWGKIDQIDEYEIFNPLLFFLNQKFSFRTILSNPIVTPVDSNERNDNVQSKSNLLLPFSSRIIIYFFLVVSNILQMNGSNKNKPIITRAPPPVPKTTRTITDDLFLIDFSDSSPEKIESNHTLEQLMTMHPSSPPPMTENSHSSPQVQQRFSNNLIDAQQFVAKVVTGVTEQLKNDFPHSNTSKRDFTPPLVRRFTVPYPSSYYNIQRPQ